MEALHYLVTGGFSRLRKLCPRFPVRYCLFLGLERLETLHAVFVPCGDPASVDVLADTGHAGRVV